jgi:hypothetical protein
VAPKTGANMSRLVGLKNLPAFCPCLGRIDA